MDEDTSSRREAAAFIAALSRDLAKIAQRHDLELVGYLLNMSEVAASEEATSQALLQDSSVSSQD